MLAVLCLLPAGPASADFLDSLKDATRKAGEVVRDVRDTVDGGREVGREAEDLRQRVVYADSHSPPSRHEASQLQGALNALGFSSGRPDGLIGDKTRDAIRLYQSATGVAVDGTISYDLIESAVRDSRRTGPVSASLSRAEWQKYQRLLNELGYDVGTPDGLPGKRTRSATTRFLNDRGLPVVDGIDRYGLTAARRASSGGGTASGGSLLPGAVAGGPGLLLPSGTSASTAFATGEPSYVIGSGDEATDDAARTALSLMLIRAHPELLESLDRVDAWFVHEGRTVESEYLREAALDAFREELAQRSAPSSVSLRIIGDVYLRKGEYDPQTGLFNARFDASRFSVRLPQLGGGLSIDLSLASQLPVVKTGELASFDPGLGIPMSLEEAIAFERDAMVDRRGRPSDMLPTVLMTDVRVDGVELEPLARDRKDSGKEFRKAEARSTLTGLSLHRSNPRGAAQRAGELVHRWTLDPASAPAPEAGAFHGAADVSQDLQAIAARFGMTVFEGHLDTGSGDLGAFAAAMAIGQRPELLDRLPDALILAQALLSREERAELFDNVRDHSELTEVAASAVHARIKGELREFLLARAVPVDLPLLVVHGATLGRYDIETESFPLGTSVRSVEEGRLRLTRSGAAPLLIADTGDRWLPERVVRSLSSRTFDVRARVTPLGAVASVDAERPDRSTLEITHRIDELAVLLIPRDTGRQAWELLGRDRFDTAQVAPAETVDDQEPVPVELGPMPMLDPDILLLMAARSADTLEASTWEWLFANRHAHDTGVRSTLGQRFFAADASTPDRGVARIELPGFQAWVGALQMPELKEVRVTFGTGYRMDRGTAERCFVATSEESWDGNSEPTFASNLDAAQRRELRGATVSNLGAGEFAVRSPGVAGFSNLSPLACLSGGRSLTAALGLEGVVAPKVTLLFDTLPILSFNVSNSAIVEATVEAIEFDAGESDLPDVTVRLAFAKASFYADADGAEADPVRTLSAADLVEPEAAGKDARMADADIVDVKIGMPLSEAAAVLDAHFPVASVTEIRRGFSTDPGRFEQGSLWIAEGGGEYVALFHEGDPEEATVLGVIRGLRLDGVDFNRDAALQALRSKYGPEDHVEAERSLAMLWGRHVIDWPQELGRTQTGYRSGKGACEIDWQANGFPNGLRDADGSPLDVREKLAAGRGRSDGFHLRWPAYRRAEQQDLTACDYYVAAFHDDGGGSARIFVGLFDIAAYEAGFEALEDGGGSGALPDAGTVEPSVKF